MSEPLFLNRADAAKRLRERYGMSTSKQWLARAATSGDGPPYVRAGKAAIYEIIELDAWALARMSRPVRRAADLRELPMTDDLFGIFDR